MAPSHDNNNDVTITNVTPANATIWHGWNRRTVYRISNSGLCGMPMYDAYAFQASNNTAPETKKERLARLSKQLMYASWKVYNDKTITIKEIKQICKPRHRLNYMAKRF